MKETLKRLTHGKKVLILGFGREGRSTLAALERCGTDAEIAIADINPIEPPRADIRVFSGEDYQKSAEGYDIVFKSPGIVLEKEVLSFGCEITSQTNVFLERFGSQTIGITGTKGKSTTTTMLYHVLSNSGVNSVMVGNIGIPCFDKAEEIAPDCKVVFELSCHQLEFVKASPHIGVIINLYEEHLDHYGSCENYFEAKKKIYRFQQPGDLIFCGAQCRDMLDSVSSKMYTVSDVGKADITVSENRISFEENSIEIPVNEIHLVGRHNYFNIGTVYGISKLLGVSDDDFINALKSYSPPAHRLEYCGNFGGIDFYDDSISTISQTCINAVKSVPNISTLLVGGMDRGIDYSDLIDFLTEESGETVIFMYDSGRRVLDEINALKKGCERFHYEPDLAGAVALAKKLTPKGRACVLSPAAASYGFFKNFEERGDAFKELIKE